MNDSDKIMEDMYLTRSKKIKVGNEFTLYYIYCLSCNKYKQIQASPPLGPGGTLSCPLCSLRKMNGPRMENSYGRIKVRPFKFKLPKEIEDE